MCIKFQLQPSRFENFHGENPRTSATVVGSGTEGRLKGRGREERETEDGERAEKGTGEGKGRARGSCSTVLRGIDSA